MRSIRLASALIVAAAACGAKKEPPSATTATVEPTTPTAAPAQPSADTLPAGETLLDKDDLYAGDADLRVATAGANVRVALVTKGNDVRVVQLRNGKVTELARGTLDGGRRWGLFQQRGALIVAQATPFADTSSTDVDVTLFDWSAGYGAFLKASEIDAMDAAKLPDWMPAALRAKIAADRPSLAAAKQPAGDLAHLQDVANRYAMNDTVDVTAPDGSRHHVVTQKVPSQKDPGAGAIVLMDGARTLAAYETIVLDDVRWGVGVEPDGRVIFEASETAGHGADPAYFELGWKDAQLVVIAHARPDALDASGGS